MESWLWEQLKDAGTPSGVQNGIWRAGSRSSLRLLRLVSILTTSLNRMKRSRLPDFLLGSGFEDQVDEVTADVVKMAGQLQLEVETEDVEELASHSQELTNEELVHVEEQRKAENQAQIQESPAQGTMTTKQMSEAFKYLETAMAIFEKMDLNL
ncbi:hypothetical protein Y1Q_0009081 [Alligator mississippiensis]|uniref:Uncharacterized protein n=1 Tax=Alligator mississippiensis TaxID=8496 RepID=A0A151M257_ALLMI|nr:hypothetical protein Y1Q_0009081 [Alligator mississippiensis]